MATISGLNQTLIEPFDTPTLLGLRSEIVARKTLVQIANAVQKFPKIHIGIQIPSDPNLRERLAPFMHFLRQAIRNRQIAMNGRPPVSIAEIDIVFFVDLPAAST
jgi:hypothetical protein